MNAFTGDGGLPSFEVRSELVIEHSAPDMQKSLRLLKAPGHLPPLDKALVDHLVYGRLAEAGCNRFPMAIGITIVHDEAPVVIQVDDELLEVGKERRLLGTGLGIEMPVQTLTSRYRSSGLTRSGKDLASGLKVCGPPVSSACIQPRAADRRPPEC